VQAFGFEQCGERVDEVIIEWQSRQRVSGAAQAQSGELLVDGFMQRIRPTPHTLDRTVFQDFAGFQFIGSSASRSSLLDPGSRVSTSVR
jgi:hypothetical protein